MVKNAIYPTTVDDAIITDAVSSANGMIFSLTNRDDWDPADPVYTEVQNIGATYAAYSIYNALDENMYGKKADRAYKAYTDLVTMFKTKNITDKGDPFFMVQYSPDNNPYTNIELTPWLDHL